MKKISINNRRYLGNKFKLLPFIKEIVDNHCCNIDSVADLFAGTGTVSSLFQDKQLIINDKLYCNYLCNFAWFSANDYDKNKIISLIEDWNNLKINKENYMTENFADTYFSRQDCSKIGYIRETIEELYKDEKINFREKAILITSLLYAMDKIAKTCGIYDAFRKNVEFDSSLELCVPDVFDNNKENIILNEDINDIADIFEADLVYLDPPYNSRQYCDAYHLLENVARWEKPEVFGTARKFDRNSSVYKSDYCTQKAPLVFEDLINKLNCKYILLSYNDTANKGDNRSNAKISDKDILRILQRKGDVDIFYSDYATYNSGKESNIKNTKERLFLCKKER